MDPASTPLPRSDASAAARAFLTPRRPEPRPLALPGARARGFDTAAGRVAAIEAGDGPPVLLVHGWEGQASDMETLARALLQSDLRVVVVDLPAHGASDGEWTSIPASARALLEVQRALGPLRAVLAHSVGAAVAVEALALGMHAQCAVLLGAPARYLDYAQAFAARAGLDAAQAVQMLAELRRLGIDVAAVSMPARAPGMRMPALFVHSGDDRVVAIEDAIASSGAWPGARLLRVQGLGHRRLLDDPAVVGAAADFVARHALSAASPARAVA